MVREGDMFKLHIEERDEDSSSDSDEEDATTANAPEKQDTQPPVIVANTMEVTITYILVITV